MRTITKSRPWQFSLLCLLAAGCGLVALGRAWAQAQVEINFSSSTATTNEKAGAVHLKVNLSARSNDTITVQFDCEDGTAVGAVSPDDYVAVSGTLIFPPGTTSLDLWVPILDDSSSEDTETFSVTLSNATNAVLGKTRVAIVSIEDGAGSSPPAATVSFEYSSWSVSESGTSVTITVLMTGNPTSAVSVDYATQDISATAGSDYTSTSGTLTWQTTDAGKTKSFTISISSDSTVEDTEFIFLVLSNPVNAGIAQYPVAFVNILDDDTPCD